MNTLVAIGAVNLLDHAEGDSISELVQIMVNLLEQVFGAGLASRNAAKRQQNEESAFGAEHCRARLSDALRAFGWQAEFGMPAGCIRPACSMSQKCMQRRGKSVNH